MLLVLQLSALTRLSTLVRNVTAHYVTRRARWWHAHVVAAVVTPGCMPPNPIHLQVLAACASQPDAYGVLTSLGRLAHLSLSGWYLPTCLPQLTGLRELLLNGVGSHMGLTAHRAAVDATLQQLTKVSTCWAPWRAVGN